MDVFEIEIGKWRELPANAVTVHFDEMEIDVYRGFTGTQISRSNLPCASSSGEL